MIYNDITLFSASSLVFNNGGYCNWISTTTNHYKSNPDFGGFKVDFLKENIVLFDKEKRLRPKKINMVEIKKDITPSIDTKNGENVFLVLTYPDTKIKEETTEKCIDNLKKSDNKIILASHYPASKNLQERVDYYLYDAYNPLMSHTLYNFYWSTIPQGKAEIRLDQLQRKSNLNQSLTVFNNIENSIKFAKSIGYDKVISISYDFILNENNLKTIDDLCKRIDLENKKGYFMLYNEGDMKLYKSVFFIIKTDFYSKIFDKIIRTPEEYNKECEKYGSHNFLENYFYSKLSSYSNDLIVEETNEDKLFNNSNINLFSGVEYLTVLPIKNQGDAFIIWFNSSNNKDSRRIEFVLENNGNIEHSTHYVKEKSYYLKKIVLSDNDNYNITANFIDSFTNSIIDKQTFNINKSNYSEILNNGLFTEN
jgi:hypothetical protein